MGNTESDSVDNYTTEEAFRLSINTTIILEACIVSNAFTFYYRCYNGPFYVRFQIFLIGFSSALIVFRDSMILTTMGKEEFSTDRTKTERTIIGISNILY